MHYLDAYPRSATTPRKTPSFGPLHPARTTRTPRSTASRPNTPTPTPASRCSRPRSSPLRARPAGGFEAFKAAFNDYAAFYRNHMMTEERGPPQIRKHFHRRGLGARQRRLVADDPLSGTRASAGAGEEDFAQIFSRLVAAPRRSAWARDRTG